MMYSVQSAYTYTAYSLRVELTQLAARNLQPATCNSQLATCKQASRSEIMASVRKIREHINTKYRKIGDAFRTMDEDHSGETSIAELEGSSVDS